MPWATHCRRSHYQAIFWHPTGCALEAARGSMEAAGAAITRVTGVTIGKRQLEELARRCAAHVEAFTCSARSARPRMIMRWC